jgi:hypothetical protein
METLVKDYQALRTQLAEAVALAEAEKGKAKDKQVEKAATLAKKLEEMEPAILKGLE